MPWPALGARQAFVLFRRVDFLVLRALDFLAPDFLTVDFLALDLRAVDFLAADFLAGDFLAVDFLAVDFFALVLRLVLVPLLFLAGTLPPAFRASERPIAMACLRLLTVLPERPLFNVPRVRSCIAFSTLLEAFSPYFAITVSAGSGFCAQYSHNTSVLQ